MRVGKKIIGYIILSVVLVGILGTVFYFVLFRLPYKMVSDRSISGLMLGNRTFAGIVTVTGDVMLVGNLKLLPGAKVQFIAGDDQRGGEEIAADGYNDEDPARLLSYAKTHSGMIILGRIEAIGTESAPIIFTSASSTPNLADWESFVFMGDGSILDHIIVEYARNGMNPFNSQPRSVARNSIFRHNLWSGPSLSNSGMTILNSDISDSGHEGIDAQSGYAVIKGNFIHNVHTGIVIVSGSADIENNVIENTGDGIALGPGVSVIERNNTITLAPSDSTLKWCYKNFCYRMYDTAE